MLFFFFFFNDTATTEIYTLSLHDALPIFANEYDKLKNKGYQQSDVIGRSGLEQVYERYLRGTQGIQKFIVNSNGETIRALGVKDPTAGDDLHLTIDLRIQRAAERQLR